MKKLPKIPNFKNMKRIKWTDKMIAAEAQKYNTRRAFAKGNRNAYAVAHNRGIMGEISKHMEPAGTGAERWIYAYLFIINGIKTAYVGQSGDPEARHIQHLTGERMVNGVNKRTRKQTELTKILNGGHEYEYILSTEAVHEEEVGTSENAWISYYKEKGYKMLNKIPGGGLGYTYKMRGGSADLAAKRVLDAKSENTDASAYEFQIANYVFNVNGVSIIYAYLVCSDAIEEKHKRHINTNPSEHKGNVCKLLSSGCAYTRSCESTIFTSIDDADAALRKYQKRFADLGHAIIYTF